MGLFRKRSGRALECPVAHAIGADGVVIYVGDSALFANFAARFTVAGDTPYSVAMRSAVLLGGATGSN